MNYVNAALLSYLYSPWSWFALALGAIIGSFLNVCIIRIPKRMFWRYSRSVCLNCESPIPFYYNIPIISFLLLRGRSACCKVKLSWQYPLVEALTAAMFVVLYWQFPFVMEYGRDVRIHYPDLIRFTHAGLFFSLLLVCSMIDLRYMIIPDVISLPMIAASLLVVFFHPELTLYSSLLGIAFGGGSLYLVSLLYFWLRREVGLGLGDVKLLAAIGGWLGYQAIIPTIFIGSLTGALVGILAMIGFRSYSLRSAIPFGPFLALGAMVHLLFGDVLRIWFQL